MSDNNAFTRREFLYSGLAVVSTITSVPAFLSRSGLALADTTMRLSSKPGVPQDRVLVVVQLSGGNDGLNTIIPFGMPEYYRARPGIKVKEDDIIKVDTDAGIGLHPSLADLREMMDDGLAAVVQGVGYPNPNRSHFASMDVWHTGDTRGGRGHGWIGKALDHHRQDIDPSLACVSIGSEAPLAAQGKQVKPVAFEKAELFRWAGRDLHPALSRTYDSINQGSVEAGPDDPTAFIFRTALDAQLASARVRDAVSRQPATSFPNSGLARQLRAVAAMIRAELPTRVYYVALGGFDTHANQAGAHERLLREFATSMRAFYNELDATDQRGRVVTLAFSEFGRRVAQNASGGTDHGAAGPVFLFGEPVLPGLRGSHPSMSKLDNGDLIFNTDFRSIYAGLLDGWMGMDAAAALGGAYRPARLLQPA